MTTTTKRTDIDLKTAVADELNWVPSINSANIGVFVTDGAVTLSGEVDSYQEKYLAVKAAQRVHGVTAIAQEIEVRASSWTHLSDTDVARNAGEALKWAIDVPPTVKAAVHDHVVTLSGEAYQHQRMAAARSVRYLGGVRDVINDIHLRTSSAAIASGIKDSIGKAFVRNAVIDRNLLTVSCAEDGAVTLEGTVHSWDERGQAEYAAWAAPGVTSVTDKLRVGL
jgi:osmotically-inducible protein OsmY